MSDIPFVNQLGDAIDVAITRPAKHAAWLRQRRSSRVAVVLAALIGLSGGVALAGGLFASSTPIELATSSPMCFESASLQEGSGPSNDKLLPVPACAQTRRLLGEPARALVACVSAHAPNGYSGVAVFPGIGPHRCERDGLKPLPAGYLTALSRVATLEHDLAKLEPSTACVPPARLAKQVQALLSHGDWTGWHVSLRTDPAEGPCGSLTGLVGGSHTSFRGSIYAPNKVVDVFARRRESTSQTHRPR
jgi:hypothetical protein